MTSEDHLGSLLEYAVEQGCDVAATIGFTVSSESGVGMVATEKIAVHDVLITIPYSQCISAANIRANASLSAIFLDNPGINDYPDEVLAIGLVHAFLLANSGLERPQLLEKCPWIPHVLTMPTFYDTPIFWEEADLQRLKGHNIFHLTKMLKRQMEVDFQTIHAPIAANYPELFPGLTFEHYVWALSCVYSRAIDFDRLGPDGKFASERIIPPLIDFANHHPQLGLPLDDEMPIIFCSRDVLKYDIESDSLQLVAGRSYEPSEHIYIIYGDYSNAKLLYTYGFVIPGGALDDFRGVDVFLKVTPSVLNSDRKQAIAQRDAELAAHGATYDFKGTVKTGGRILPSLRRMTRLLQADSDELTRIEASPQALNNTISIGNEIRTNRSLRALFIARMRLDDAEEERRRLGELLLSSEGAPTGNKEFMALLVQCEDRDILMEAVAALDEEHAQLLQRMSRTPPGA